MLYNMITIMLLNYRTYLICGGGCCCYLSGKIGVFLGFFFLLQQDPVAARVIRLVSLLSQLQKTVEKGPAALLPLLRVCYLFDYKRAIVKCCSLFL